ncbi:cupin domain-containing protein [Spirosoma validum]|uniref:Cupin domain-containing protein n=1 Tax=Spirosoma validum TaxID=2771355 RepID=A0A927B4X6_9BACT|nr:cupin domain-containing protein [Spirosoma validum]MBD2755720.1 cupin domain-containing protein [Spirosoma validum]
MNKELLCLGHKISVHQPLGNFDLVEGTTPPNVPGPPPHYHTGYNELFLVLEGKMEFMKDGKLTTVETGESIDLPPNTLHTFKNAGDTPCRWLNIHSPKGFLSFFEEFGINAQEGNAFEKSVDSAVINKVIQKATSYDMHIVMP